MKLNHALGDGNIGVYHKAGKSRSASNPSPWSRFIFTTLKKGACYCKRFSQLIYKGHPNDAMFE